MIKFKVDIIEELKKININSTILKQSGYIGQKTLTRLRRGESNITLKELNKLCCLLECQPRDIIKYVETEEDTQQAKDTINLAKEKTQKSVKKT